MSNEERILQAIETLRADVAKLFEQVASRNREQDLFWSKDWVNLLAKVEKNSAEIGSLQQSLSGAPATLRDHEDRLRLLEKFKWQMLAFATFGSAIGAFVVQFFFTFLQ